MALDTHEKLESLRPGETVRFPIEEASAAFADERSLQGGQSLGSNFDRFIRDRITTHRVEITEGELIVTRLP